MVQTRSENGISQPVSPSSSSATFPIVPVQDSLAKSNVCAVAALSSASTSQHHDIPQESEALNMANWAFAELTSAERQVRLFISLLLAL